MNNPEYRLGNEGSGDQLICRSELQLNIGRSEAGVDKIFSCVRARFLGGLPACRRQNEKKKWIVVFYD